MSLKRKVFVRPAAPTSSSEEAFPSSEAAHAQTSTRSKRGEEVSRLYADIVELKSEAESAESEAKNSETKLAKSEATKKTRAEAKRLKSEAANKARKRSEKDTQTKKKGYYCQDCELSIGAGAAAKYVGFFVFPKVEKGQFSPYFPGPVTLPRSPIS